MSDTAPDVTIRKSALWRHGLLAAPLAFAGLPLYIYAPDYFATEYGLSLAALGFILLLIRCFDAVQDPLFGVLSDTFSHKRGTLLFAAAATLVASFALLFQPLGAPLLWFSLFMLIATAAFSLLSINLYTISALWGKSTQDKTRITTVREACGLIGLLLAVTLPSILQQSLTPSHAFALTSGVLLILMVIALLFFRIWFNAHTYLTHQNTQSSASSVDKAFSLKRTLSKIAPLTCRFYGIYALAMLASSIPAVLVIFFIRDLLGNEEYVGPFLLLYFLSGIVFMHGWTKLSERIGKYKAWGFSMLVAILSFVWCVSLGEGDFIAYGIICVLSGSAFGANLTLPPSILADHIASEKAEDEASFYFSILTFLIKFSLAVGSAIALPWLEGAGFSAGAANDAHSLATLKLLYAGLPSMLMGTAAIWLLLSLKQFNAAHSSSHYTPSQQHGAPHETPNTSPHSNDRSHPHA